MPRWCVGTVLRVKSHGSRVLVAEDDAAVRNAVVRVLELDGHRVQSAKDGRTALDAIIDDTPDAVVMDVMMPFVDGLTVCREVRNRGNRVPILLLTARVEVDDRVAGLDAGADDYLTKPFAVAELSARVRALLRRNSSPETHSKLAVGSLNIDRDTRSVTRNGRRIELTKTEFNLLELLAEQAGLVVTREYIYDNVWGYNFETNSKSLDVYIGYLRRKLNAPDEVDPIRTVRGVGYSLESV
ncbi:MAG: two-component response regulator MprA [Actinomycetota bacterium]